MIAKDHPAMEILANRWTSHYPKYPTGREPFEIKAYSVLNSIGNTETGEAETPQHERYHTFKIDIGLRWITTGN